MINNETKIKEQALALMDTAEGFIVETQEDAQTVADTMKHIKQLEKQVDDFLGGAKDKAYAAYKEINAKIKMLKDPLEQAKKMLKGKLAKFYEREEARKRAEEEEARQRKIALEQEMAAAAEEVDFDKMLEIKVQKEELEVPIAKPKVIGTHVRKKWKARIIDDAAVPIGIMGMTIRPIDMSQLDSLARMSKGTAKVPGVEFYEETIVVQR
jgi:hypothetical protein